MQQPGVRMPLPDWYTAAMIAGRWHTDPETVMSKPLYWIARETSLMEAESFIAAENRGKQQG